MRKNYNLGTGYRSAMFLWVVIVNFLLLSYNYDFFYTLKILVLLNLIKKRRILRPVLITKVNSVTDIEIFNYLIKLIWGELCIKNTIHGVYR